jgi:Rieske Fe-S protein
MRDAPEGTGTGSVVEHGGECAGCPVASRRAFLRDSLATLAGVALSLGLARRSFALPVGTTSAHARMGSGQTYPIPAADGVQIDHDAQVILVRWQNAVYAFALSCPHQNTALRWVERDARFQCPKHKSRYEPDGSFISGRATRPMDRFAIRRDNDNVIVDLDHLYRKDETPAEWTAAAVQLA